MLSPYAHEGRQRQARISGEWVDVVEWGEGEPLVLIPGLAGGWKLVAPLATRLARHYHVIVPGLRGDRFPSGAPAAQDMGDLAHDLGLLLDQMGLELPTVFGVSFGGAVALELAASQPGRLGALVLQGVEAKFRVNLGAKIARRVLERFPLPSDNGFVNQFFNLLHGGKPESSALSEFVVERCWETDQSVMAQRIGLLGSFDVSDRLWSIDVPTMILAGTRDVIVPTSRQKALAASIAGARYEAIEGAGHVGFLTHRAEISQKIRGFLRSVRHSHC
ncbi:alpha/beta fold hydrolase [Singulisphaera sp. PoT]|uniref:alpha/beta fold hydrolase n=1 Tax=Singulisphaera sp. PoT TaxID=3411797 RepID=UPI003BF4EFEE